MKDNTNPNNKTLDKDLKAPKKTFGVHSFRLSVERSLIERPKFEDDKTKGWIKYGDKNLFPDYLLRIYSTSGKHSAIINRKIKMIAGKGFEEDNVATQNVQGLYSGKKTAKLMTSDQEILKGHAVFMRWNSKKSKVVAYDYLPFHKVRQGIDEETFFVSEDWSHSKKFENIPILYNKFEFKPGLSQFYKKLPNKTKKEKAIKEEQLRLETVEILYTTDVTVGSEAYPVPNYFPSIEWIITDSEVGKYSLNLVLNDFLGAFHIGFKNGIPEADEREREVEAFEKQYTGSDGKKIIVTFSEPDSEGIDFNALPTAGNENILENTEKRAAENIFIAHEVTSPILFGIKTEGQLGGRAEMIEALAIFQAVYIDDQQELIEDTFDIIYEAMGAKEKEANLKTYSLGEAKEGEKPAEVEFTITNKKRL